MKLPSEVPVMTLPNAILFPQALLPLRIFEPRYRQMLDDVLATHRMFSVALRKPGSAHETPFSIAGLGLVRASVQNKDGTSHVILQGIGRVRFAATVRRKPYRVARIEPLERPGRKSAALDPLVARVRELVAARIVKLPGAEVPVFKPKAADDPKQPVAFFPLKEFIGHLDQVQHPDQIADMVACTLLRHPLERQLILETVRVDLRLRHLIHFLTAEDTGDGKDCFNE